MTLRDRSENQSHWRRATARALPACVGFLAVLANSLALASGTNAPARPPAATMSDCQNLLKQFDVAWPAHREATRAASARHSRDQGEADCQGGRYADAVRNLRRALHDIGVKPVKSVSIAPSR